MKTRGTSIFGHLTQFKTRLGTIGLPRRPTDAEPPLRSELFSAEQMEQHGKTLAAAHALTPHRARDQLLPRLAANESALIDVCNRLTTASSANHRITPAGEWLLDNFHLIEEQVGMAKRHLPRGYSLALPRLAHGPSAGLPRVYDIALETISHGDGRVDAETLSRFVAAYQTVTPLKVGELWAIPIMLRLALIENLRRVGVRMAAGKALRDLANTWADQMMEMAERDPKSLILVIADMARSTPPIGSAFVAEFARRLQGQSPALALALTWIEQQLAESHLTIEQLVQVEARQQASDQVSISNSIGSLRLLSAIDWREFVEATSVVEAILRRDPAGVYGEMEFATRDRYRHATERVARDGRMSEAETAAKAIELAGASAAARGNDDRSAHVGFYLIDDGLAELKRAAGVADSLPRAVRRIGERFPLAVYLGSIGFITGIFTAGLAANAYAGGASGEVLVAIVALSLLVTSQFAVAIANRLAMLLVKPHPLPRIDFSAGIAAPFCTLVVVPAMLTGARDVEELAEALEVRFLANRDPHLYFGLLTDFPDASDESLPTDAPLLRLVQTRIDELNRTYGHAASDAPTARGAASGSEASHAPNGDPFFLFHRPRRWNAQERRWMGYERKRGKLGDLNSLLRGGHRGGFSVIVGTTEILRHVKYVITLDTDTELPRDSAREFIGAMAHPLNRPRFDDSARRREIVTAGYGILQPRVAASLPGTNRSRYARLHGGEPGLDPYTRTVSDVYQDLYGEGSFIGKGIYDVDAFERALAGRFPENRVLSHDLLEGCYARAGLLSDAQLYEDFPARYGADVARRHRWIRGDWQLAGWLRRRVPGKDGRRERNPLSMLSQWKLFDNLRRSLVPAAMLSLLLLGWTVLAPAWFWTAVVVVIMMLSSPGALLADLLDKPAEVLFRQHVDSVARAGRRHATQLLLTLAFLPHETWYCLDAILRTLVRMWFTSRRLLEWNPSSVVDRAVEQDERSGLLASFRAMWIAPVVAVATWAGLSLANPAALVVAWPILLLWLASPAIAWWVSRPLARHGAKLRSSQTRFLRRLARRTWSYFEAYVGPDDHWLPPDNMQEHPAVGIAHRTSPTNMGLSLLANLTAYDFGYLSAGQLVLRTANSLRTMESLERYRGHFYNWYDTRTRSPLLPTYVSSVDSGNLAGHLLTLRAGLAALPDAPILCRRWRDGMQDTFDVLRETIGDELPAPVAEFRKALDEASAAGADTLATAWSQVELLVVRASGIAEHFAATADDSASDALFWARLLVAQCAEIRDELGLLAPWLLPRARPSFGPDDPFAAGMPTLRELAVLDTALLPVIEHARRNGATVEERARLHWLAELVTQGAQNARERLRALDELAQQAGALAEADFDFLFDKVRRQLAIGYNVGERRRDASYYDLLASEARLCNFVAIAQGHLPQESWFALGRQLTIAGGTPVLLSWSGSMFEYLMPLLVMPTYENTLLDQTYAASVERQIEYGNERGLPWGISECGYNTVDVHLNYQYRAFGVPGLGMKRGLGDDLVVAPYASALALMVAPEAACSNLQRLAEVGLAGRHGMFEAIDYTPSRQRRGESSVVVKTFMAHHQGMSLLAIAYLLLARPMQGRFVSDPLFQATLLLLQERVPRATRFYSNAMHFTDVPVAGAGPELPVRVLSRPNMPTPEVQLLSNGRYHVMVTNAGGGSSRWQDLSVTRWHEDGTCDNWGTFCYLRETASGEFWSAAHQPTLAQAEHYEAIFSEGRAEFRRRDLDFETHTEILVSPEDDIELRRVRIANRSRSRRTIEVTSYAEVVLAPAAADALHPAFSNLFVQTEIIPGRQAILCTRRPRSRKEHVPWMFHLMTVHGRETQDVSFETDRMRFIGRGRSVAAPHAMLEAGPLSGTSGSVLDPIVAIRHRIALDAGASATIDIVSGAADTREVAMSLVEKYQDRRLADRVFDLTWTHSQVVLRQLNATEADSQLYGRLAGSVIFANAAQRAPASVLVRNRRGQSGLWGYAISGDIPIVLLQIADAANIDLVRQLVQAHAYWRLKGLAVDLVIWNDDHDVYRQQLQEQIMGLIAAGVEAHYVDRPGGIFVRQAEQISIEDRILFQSVARVIIADARGTLSEQIGRRAPAEVRIPRLVPTLGRRPEAHFATVLPRDDLILRNGIGGFTPDGREYVIAPLLGEATPVPWVNVIANPRFGTVVSETGHAYTWCENAHLFRLTPWHNDPVGDASGEAIYIRDEETGHFWSPASPHRDGSAPYVTRHGFGYSVFEHVEDGVHSELTVFVALDAGIKFSSLKVSNRSGRPRRLSATGYLEWVLADLRAKSAMHVTTEIDSRNGALYARNRYHTEFAEWVAFFDVDDPNRTVTGDRTEFLGRNGTLRDPAAMHRTHLSGRVGAALDPCAAMQVPFDLADGQDYEVHFRLGAASNADAASALVKRFRGSAVARETLEAVVRHWQRQLACIQVETPDPALDVMTNGWLLYQVIACRLFARSGYYQSGGAFGFRDQLQDVMALVHAEPQLARAQIALCARRQFVEGDVQHWWHPPSGRGVRTHCSDDYLWLPLATSHYVLATGDATILDESAPFLEGRPVNAEDDSYYDLPGRSDETASIYQHCVRAILHGLRVGAHGLPLIGSGDWNDGMNLVGMHGKGESVWLAFFLCTVLREFAKVARLHDDAPFALRCDKEAAQLRKSIERHAWDGEWYRRAYFDDGSPLGSRSNAECQIDSVAQSWSVLSGAGNAQRSRQAMNAVHARLVRRDSRLIQLLDPPFDTSDLEPGYIRGYVPGVRENGGQYTHGAIWTAMAFAALGDTARAWEAVDIINPVNHSRTPEGAATYQVEPYVVAADVYALSPHVGRGGWTWYTGSAGWMYRLIVESLLGLKREGNRLHLAPRLPAGWSGFKLRYRHGETHYHIVVRRTEAEDERHVDAMRVTIDGVAHEDGPIALVDDRQEHRVEVDVATGELRVNGRAVQVTFKE